MPWSRLFWPIRCSSTLTIGRLTTNRRVITFVVHQVFLNASVVFLCVAIALPFSRFSAGVYSIFTAN